MITLVCTDVRLTHHQTRFHPRSRTAAVETVAAPQAVLSSIQRQLEAVRLCFMWPAFSLLLSLPFHSLPEWVKYSTDYPSFHILFKESPPPLPPPRSSDDFKFLCLCLFWFSVLFYFHHVYFFLDLVFSLTFQTVLSLTFFSRLFMLLKFPFCENKIQEVVWQLKHYFGCFSRSSLNSYCISNIFACMH